MTAGTELQDELDRVFSNIFDESASGDLASSSQSPSNSVPASQPALPHKSRMAAGTSPNPTIYRQDGTDDRVGDVLNDSYELLGVLGRGGLGTVYRARHVLTGDHYAIKLLNAVHNDEASTARLRREAFATARLDHPNCVRIWEVGTTDTGGTFLVMELLDGQPLSELLAEQGRLPLNTALRIAQQILNCLSHAHRRNVVHRDLKPENIFICRNDDGSLTAKLLDFGIAKLIGDALDEAGGDELTRTGTAPGTPLYMSPEQLTGSALDGRTDLYSVSVILFELISGEPPFNDPHPFRIAVKHRTGRVPRIAEIAPELQVPAGIDVLIRRGMAKTPQARFGTAGEYVSAIDALMTR